MTTPLSPWLPQVWSLVVSTCTLPTQTAPRNPQTPGTQAAVPPAGSNTDLVRRAAAGDQSAWRALIDRYSGLLRGIARSHRLDEAAVADVVQTCWLRLVEHIDRIHEPERVDAWLAVVARRQSLHELARTRRERPSEAELDFVAERIGKPEHRVAAPLIPHVQPAEPVDGKLLRAEDVARVRKAVALLPKRQSRMLELLAADPAPTYEMVSALLDMPIGSIGPTRQRALRRLAELLTEEPGEACSAA